MLAVVVAAWYLRRRDIPEDLRGGPTFSLLLVVSSIAIAVLGLYTVMTVFGFRIG